MEIKDVVGRGCDLGTGYHAAASEIWPEGDEFSGLNGWRVLWSSFNLGCGCV